MSVQIREVTNKKDLKDFISFPFELYKKDKYWIPPLKSGEVETLDKNINPAFDHCEAKYWLAYKDGKIVGRIAAIINHAYVDKWNQKHGRFGWIDFIDDQEVSDALLSTAEKWVLDNGMTAIHGPLGFTDLDYEGMLVEGFEEIGNMATIYNYPYYPVHLEKLGYKPDINWVEYQILNPKEFPERLARLSTLMEEKLKLKVLRLKKSKDILPYAHEIFDVINSAYKNLYGVVSLTERQIEYYIKQYFGFIRADFVSLVANEKGEIVALGITIPSLAIALQKAKGSLFPFGFIHLLRAMRKNDKAELLLVAVRPDYQGKAINAILMREMNEIYLKNNVTVAETNPELESNELVQAFWKLFERRQHKKRTCFIKELSV